jgi:hypothetical protein
MGRVNRVDSRALITSAVLGAALASAILMSPVGTGVARAQTESTAAANGVLLPPEGFDPAAARSGDLAESAAVAATSTASVAPADESIAADAPEASADASDAVADAPETGNSMTTSLGGSDVSVASVGGSHEVDRPGKRSERKK